MGRFMQAKSLLQSRLEHADQATCPLHCNLAFSMMKRWLLRANIRTHRFSFPGLPYPLVLLILLHLLAQQFFSLPTRRLLVYISTFFLHQIEHFHVCNRTPKRHASSPHGEAFLHLEDRGHLRLRTLLMISVPTKTNLRTPKLLPMHG